MEIYKNEEGIFKLSDNKIFLLKIGEIDKKRYW